MSDNENIVNNSEFNIRIIPIQELQDISTQDIQLGDFYLPVGIKDEQDQTFEKSTRKISFIDLQEILHTIPNVDQFPTVGIDHNGLMSKQDKIKLDGIQIPIINNIPLVSTGIEEQEYQDATNGLMSIEDKRKLDNLQIQTINDIPLATIQSNGLMSAYDKNKINRMQIFTVNDIPNATTIVNGLMSKQDKIKLDGLPSITNSQITSWNSKISSIEIETSSSSLEINNNTINDTQFNSNISFKNQQVNTILAGPISIPENNEDDPYTEAPSFRKLVEADLPLIDIGTKTIGNLSWGRITEPELQQSSQVYISPSNIEEGSTATPEWRKITKEDLPTYENEFRVITASFNYSIGSKKQKDGNVNITIPNNYICLGICGYNLANYFIFPSRLQYIYNSSNGPQISYDFFNAHDSKTLSGTATIQLICIKKTI